MSTPHIFWRKINNLKEFGICDIKGHIFTNTCFNLVVYTQMFMISFEFHTKMGIYSLFTRYVKTVQGNVHGFSHVCDECLLHDKPSHIMTS